MYSPKLNIYIIHENDDWYISLLFNLKKLKVDYEEWSIDDLKDSNIIDQFNEIFDLNTYNYDENENEVKENLNQHKNQNSNFFLEALS